MQQPQPGYGMGMQGQQPGFPSAYQMGPGGAMGMPAMIPEATQMSPYARKQYRRQMKAKRKEMKAGAKIPPLNPQPEMGMAGQYQVQPMQ